MATVRWPTQDVVGPFEGDSRFLSNFAPIGVRYDGTEFATAEHAYQAAKARNKPDIYDRIAAATDPDEAKRLGRRVALPDDWEDRKRYVMLEVVTAKFGQHPDYRERLLETGRRTIVELNSWDDTYWGADIETGLGRNVLGRILMGVRSTLRFDRGP
ncbi:NADAR family protein [Haloglomus salinum]|uniref:NADAR family protein n=1 Tax=Haloglomus salinum TaxID=2962673 RepID=UPI0020C9909A|nr:NADAR family protein [Haloglomus salinum]